MRVRYSLVSWKRDEINWAKVDSQFMDFALGIVMHQAFGGECCSWKLN